MFAQKLDNKETLVNFTYLKDVYVLISLNCNLEISFYFYEFFFSYICKTIRLEMQEYKTHACIWYRHFWRLREQFWVNCKGVCHYSEPSATQTSFPVKFTPGKRGYICCELRCWRTENGPKFGRRTMCYHNVRQTDIHLVGGPDQYPQYSPHHNLFHDHQQRLR